MGSLESSLSKWLYQFTFPPRTHGKSPVLHPGAAVLQKRMDMWPSSNTHLPLVVPFGDELPITQLNSHDKNTLAPDQWKGVSSVCKTEGRHSELILRALSERWSAGWDCQTLWAALGHIIKQGDCGAGLPSTPSFAAL